MTEESQEIAMEILRQAPLLKACRTSPHSRRALIEVTNTSRTTVYRSTVALTEQGLLERTMDGYRTTPLGDALGQWVTTYLDGIDAVAQLEPLLDVVSHPDLLEHAHKLTDATVMTVDVSDPYCVVDRSIERFEAARDIRGVVSSTSPIGLLDAARELIDTKDRIEWLFTERAIEVHDTVGGEAFLNMLEAPHLSVGIVPDEAAPFTFSVDRNDVSISGHDPTSGLPIVIAESESPAAWAWLDDQFTTLQDQATPFEAHAFS